MHDGKDEKEIIKKFLSGDEDAFSHLVGKYLDNLYNFIFSFIGEAMATEDVVQETFLKAWKNMKRFDLSKNFKTWLFAIGKNTAMDHLKKKRATPFSFFENEEGGSPFENIVDEEELADQIIAREESGKDLEEAMESISKKYRIILELCYKEDMSLSEISEVLEISYNTVKSQHTRALLALKKELLS